MSHAPGSPYPRSNKAAACNFRFKSSILLTAPVDSSDRGPKIVPFSDSGALSAHLISGATLKVYPGFPHGMCQIHADLINQDLLAFISA